MTRHADINNDILKVSTKEVKKETFVNQMTARGYELETVANGNISDITVRLVPLANYVVYIDTPTVTA